MQGRWIEEYEQGDKVKLLNYDWYIDRGFNILTKDEILIVEFQDGKEVWTNKGIFEFDELELVE